MAALFVSPPSRCALFCGGEGGRNYPSCPGTALGGQGDWSSSTCAVEAETASAPCAPPPEGWGWGSIDVPCSCPPPPPLRGVRDPRGGGQCPPLWLPKNIRQPSGGRGGMRTLL